MIVIEGVDLSGKTTLAEYIANRYNLEYVHLGRPEPGKRHWDQAVEVMGRKSDKIVCDRLVIGSMVYGNYLKDEYNFQPVTQPEIDLWMGWMRRHKGMIIYAHCSLTTLRYRYAMRGDFYLKLRQLEDIRDIYEPTMANIERYYSSVYHYDSDQYNPERWCNGYNSYLQQHMEHLDANS